MSAVDVIAAALAAGAAAGMKDTASTAVRDAYAGLKHLLDGRLVGRDDARRALEANETEPGVWQTRLGEALVGSGAAVDAQVLDAAERLLTLVEASRAEGIDVRVGTNYGAVGNFNAPVTFNQAPSVPPAVPVLHSEILNRLG